MQTVLSFFVIVELVLSSAGKCNLESASTIRYDYLRMSCQHEYLGESKRDGENGSMFGAREKVRVIWDAFCLGQKSERLSMGLTPALKQ